MCLLKEVVCHLPSINSPKAPFLSLIQKNYPAFVGFPSTSAVKYPPVMQEPQETWVQSLGQEDPSPGWEHGNPLQYSCLENPMDRGTWWATVYRVAKSRTWLRQLSTDTSILPLYKMLICLSHTFLFRSNHCSSDKIKFKRQAQISRR